MPEVGTVYQKSFEWKILNFLNLDLNQGKSIESPPFILIGKDGIQKKFYLMLFPKGDKEADWVAVYLTSYDSLISCTLSYKVSILDKEEKQFILLTVKDRTYCEKDLGWGSNKLIQIQKLKSQEELVLPNGTLTILFELDSVKDRPKDPTMCLVDDLETLATNDEFTDIEIQCKDTMIKAHKAILGSRSSVFKAMFTNACKESQSGSVNINNMEPEVLKDLITFMYSCKVKNLKENVADLFIAADMYMIQSLKDMCGTYMMNNLTNANAISYLNLADGHNCKMLKDAAMNYIVANVNDFMERPELKKVSQDLVIEIMKGVVMQKNN